MPQPDRQQDADAYRALLERIRQSCGCAEADDEQPLPGELEIQALWHAGLLGSCGETMRHGRVRILDFGEWNRSAGPDFQRAEIEIDGIRHHGDIEIDPTAQDWERHGHGANPDYTNVVLHIVLRQPPAPGYPHSADSALPPSTGSRCTTSTCNRESRALPRPPQRYAGRRHRKVIAGSSGLPGTE